MKALALFLLAIPLLAQRVVAPGQINRVSGNGRVMVTTTGEQTADDCVKIDANGNHIAAGSACGSSGSAGGDLAGTYPNPTLDTSITTAITWSGSQTMQAHNAMGSASVDANVVLNLEKTFAATNSPLGIRSSLSVSDVAVPSSTSMAGGFFELKAQNAVQTINTDLNAIYGASYHETTGTVKTLAGVYLDSESFGGGNVNRIYGAYVYTANTDSTVDNYAAGVYINSIDNTNGTLPLWYGVYVGGVTGAAATTAYGVYVPDMAGDATNMYYSWFDSRGVGRCREDNAFNSVGQSICVVYNPQFTKYTPGAANYERITYGQWNSNVAEMGAEAGGTGTQRNLRLLGAEVLVPAIAAPAGQTCTVTVDENGQLGTTGCA